ncbi:MAG: hypothetical protein Ct9H300mP32_2240 [Verrucomicrobiota bacterium]|nr:MAG: hypothetical protein Ct9H300mP32_2240 [Verrucomicrobiota bacterium]
MTQHSTRSGKNSTSHGTSPSDCAYSQWAWSRIARRKFNAVVRGHEEMEGDIPPDPCRTRCRGSSAWARRYKLCIVSDAIVSPGSCLRRLLENHGLAKFLTDLPSPTKSATEAHRRCSSRRRTARGRDKRNAAHRDRDHNDVKGPQQLGMKAILLPPRESGQDNTSADAICESFDKLGNSN